MTDVLKKIKEEMKNMKSSRDLSYTKTYISCNNDCGFSIECIRSDTELEWDSDYYGSVIFFEIYYQRYGKDVDCCTVRTWDDPKDLEEFANMWR